MYLEILTNQNKININSSIFTTFPERLRIIQGWLKNVAILSFYFICVLIPRDCMARLD